MKAIKLTAIGIILFLAFSCKKGRTRPTPVVNYKQTQALQDPYKIIKTGSRNKSFPTLKYQRGRDKEIWNDNQFNIFRDQEKRSKPAIKNDNQYLIFPNQEMITNSDSVIK